MVSGSKDTPAGIRRALYDSDLACGRARSHLNSVALPVRHCCAGGSPPASVRARSDVGFADGKNERSTRLSARARSGRMDHSASTSSSDLRQTGVRERANQRGNGCPRARCHRARECDRLACAPTPRSPRRARSAQTAFRRDAGEAIADDRDEPRATARRPYAFADARRGTRCAAPRRRGAAGRRTTAPAVSAVTTPRRTRPGS